MTPELTDHPYEVLIAIGRQGTLKLKDRLEASSGAREYSQDLFPQDFFSNRFINQFFPLLNRDYYRRFLYMRGRDACEVSGKDVENQLGGKREFFRSGTLVLDLGSGAGIAVREFSKKYQKNKVGIVGVDLEYCHDKPSSTKAGNYVGATWRVLPFADNSFNGVLCHESFPRFAVDSDNQAVVSEITRVSREGAIFRASLFPERAERFDPEEAESKRRLLAQGFVENGWEVYLHPRLMIARLVDKRTP